MTLYLGLKEAYMTQRASVKTHWGPLHVVFLSKDFFNLKLLLLTEVYKVYQLGLGWQGTLQYIPEFFIMHDTANQCDFLPLPCCTCGSKLETIKFTCKMQMDIRIFEDHFG